jgi:MOSC domain-containing protein YiiM
MWTGTVVSILITPAACEALQPVNQVRAVPGKGLEGDRYFEGRGTWSTHPGTGRQVTLIESEVLEALKNEAGPDVGPVAHRRNIVTRGAPLNHLVGRTFRIGEVVFRGMRLCEPCAHLEEVTLPGIRSALLHRGGLRADVIREGVIRVGDTIQET